LLGRQSHLNPDGTQGNQEGAVHHTLKVRSESHAYVGETLFDEAREKPEQE